MPPWDSPTERAYPVIFGILWCSRHEGDCRLGAQLVYEFFIFSQISHEQAYATNKK